MESPYNGKLYINDGKGLMRNHARHNLAEEFEKNANRKRKLEVNDISDSESDSSGISDSESGWETDVESDSSESD